MGYSIRHMEAENQFSRLISFEVLNQMIPEALIEQVIDGCQVREKRSRKLPARLVMWLCVGMHIFSAMGLRAALLRMVRGSRLLGDASVDQVANKSSISKARYRLGVAPMEQLFASVCQVLASPATPGAFAFGLRLGSIDSTVEYVPDTPENSAHFGRQPANSKFPGSAFPQVRCVYACECGTHAIFDAVFMPYLRGDVHGAVQLLRAVQPDMLVLLDCGLYGFDMIQGIRQRGAHFLGRIRTTIRPACQQILSDGSYLATITASDPQRKRQGEGLLVRVIEYTFDDPIRPGHGAVHRLITTLLDPVQYPAMDLIVLYHERWEIELTIDEIDTHQRLSTPVLRSLHPLGVIQELYGLLLAHYLVRAIMHQAALTQALDPDRLSFVNALRLIQDALADFQLIDPDQHDRLWQRLLADMATFRLPPRENRINPRVVKQKVSKFKAKRSHHLRPPKPKPFQADLVLIRSLSCA